MKVKQINIKNLGKFTEFSVSFNDDITYLVGSNGAGKTTVGLDAIWIAMQSVGLKASAGGGDTPFIAERIRVIGGNGKSAEVSLTLVDDANNGMEIKVTRKITSSGTSLSFDAPNAPSGYVLDQDFLNRLFSVFMISPKKFYELNPKEQAISLGIDTSKFDAEIAGLKSEYTSLNAVYRNYGDIPVVEKVESVDIKELQKQQTQLKDALNAKYKENVSHNQNLRNQYNLAVEQEKKATDEYNRVQSENKRIADECASIKERLKQLGYEHKSLHDFCVQKMYDVQPSKVAKVIPMPQEIDVMPDSSELISIQDKIDKAATINIQAANYVQYLSKVESKAKAKDLVDQNTAKQKESEQKRLEYIKSFKLPFGNLSIDEVGGLLLDNRVISRAYFSHGELIKIIPILLSTKNPELKYIFIEDFSLMDDDKQQEVISYLLEQGFQLVVEVVGKEKAKKGHSILLKECKEVDSYETKKESKLSI